MTAIADADFTGGTAGNTIPGSFTDSVGAAWAVSAQAPGSFKYRAFSGFPNVAASYSGAGGVSALMYAGNAAAIKSYEVHGLVDVVATNVTNDIIGVFGQMQAPASSTNNFVQVDYDAGAQQCRFISTVASSATVLSTPTVARAAGTQIVIKLVFAGDDTVTAWYSLDAAKYGVVGTGAGWVQIGTTHTLPAGLRPLGYVGSIGYSPAANGLTIGLPKAKAFDFASNVLMAGTPFAVQEGSGTAYVGATATLNGVSPTYQWYRSTAGGTQGSAVSGATTLAFTDTGLSAGTTYYYTLVVTDGATTATSTQVSVAIAAGFRLNNAAIVPSPGAIYFDGSNHAHLIDNGTYFKLDFTGTSLRISVDVSRFKTGSVAAANWPKLLVNIDGAPAAYKTITDPGTGISVASVVLATGLAGGTHHAQILMDRSGDETNSYGGASSTLVDDLNIYCLVVDSGSTIAAPTLFAAARPNQLMVFGDSITNGYDAKAPGELTTGYPLARFADVLGYGLNAETAVVGKSGQGWANTYNSWTDLLPNSYWHYYAGVARVFPAAGAGLNVAVFAEGTNDQSSDVTSTVQAHVLDARTRIGAGTWLIYVSPFNDTHQAQIAAGVAAYKAANPSDLKVGFIRLATLLPVAQTGGADWWTIDGTHPNRIWHALIGAALAGEIMRLTTAGSGGGLTVAVVGVASTASVTWNAVSGAVSYKVYRKSSPTGTLSYLSTVNAPTVAYTDPSPLAGTSYYVVTPDF